MNDVERQTLQTVARAATPADLSILQAALIELSPERPTLLTTVPGSNNDKLWTAMVALGWMAVSDPLEVAVPTKVYVVNPAAHDEIKGFLTGNGSGLAPINAAQLYYECAGSGPTFVMIHAGVADNRQWDNEFAHFAQRYRVVRFDMRGYGASEPVAGEFSHLRDLIALLAYLHIDDPLILMGCSMGGRIAMDFALTYPTKVRALIMVGSLPSGMRWLDESRAAKFRMRRLLLRFWIGGFLRLVGALDAAAELDTRTWFDGVGRTPAQVDQTMRKLAYDMGRRVLEHESKKLGNALPDADTPAVNRLDMLHLPVLVIVGAHDLPGLLRAADYMTQHIPSARKVVMQDAAHLPNMDHPAEFRRAVEKFLADDVRQ